MPTPRNSSKAGVGRKEGRKEGIVRSSTRPFIKSVMNTGRVEKIHSVREVLYKLSSLRSYMPRNTRRNLRIITMKDSRVGPHPPLNPEQFLQCSKINFNTSTTLFPSNSGQLYPGTDSSQPCKSQIRAVSKSPGDWPARRIQATAGNLADQPYHLGTRCFHRTG